MKAIEKRTHYHRRALRVRKKLERIAHGYWRITIFRSHQHIYAQVIDDNIGKTVVSANDFQLEEKKGLTKTDKAFLVGRLLAQKIKKLDKVEKLVIDRGGYAYHGRVAALVEGLRKEGVKI